MMIFINYDIIVQLFVGWCREDLISSGWAVASSQDRKVIGGQLQPIAPQPKTSPSNLPIPYQSIKISQAFKKILWLRKIRIMQSKKPKLIWGWWKESVICRQDNKTKVVVSSIYNQAQSQQSREDRYEVISIVVLSKNDLYFPNRKEPCSYVTASIADEIKTRGNLKRQNYKRRTFKGYLRKQFSFFVWKLYEKN